MPVRSSSVSLTSFRGFISVLRCPNRHRLTVNWRLINGKTMTSRGTPSRFLQSVLQNGVGRYVCQLKRISIVFSRKAQGSLGVREFIEEGVVDYAKKNPATVVYVSPQSCRIPKITAEYLNGNVREEIVTNKTAPQISDLLTKLTNQSGLDIIRIRKPFHTDSPSIQGQWHPFTNRPPSIGPIRPQKQEPK